MKNWKAIIGRPAAMAGPAIFMAITVTIPTPKYQGDWCRISGTKEHSRFGLCRETKQDADADTLRIEKDKMVGYYPNGAVDPGRIRTLLRAASRGGQSS